MRLTLRTLLAYMDEILEPGDREELAKKVESSDFANDLILRTKDTMRRLRLSAPQVVGTGMALDPNTVAEYLDNVLPPDAVADFERICLESDVHLAEVASAHHVLTMVLGEAADVDPVARQRMYGIPAEAERQKQLQAEAARPAAVAERPVLAPTPPRMAPAANTFAPARSRTAEVPDYLRASAWSGSRLALGALAAALLLGIGSLIWFGASGWQGEPVAMNAPAAALSDTPAPPPLPEAYTTTTPSEEATSEPPAEAAPPAVEPPAAEATSSAPVAMSPPPLALPSMSRAEEPPAAETVAVETVEAVELAEPEAPAAEPDPYAVTSDNPAGTSVPTGGAPVLPPQPTTTPPPVETVATSEATAPPVVDETRRVASSGPAAPLGDTIAAGPAEEPRELGTFLDGRNVLLKYSPARESWFRMAPQTMLQPGDRLLALPAFHPKLTLVSGLYLKMAGGSLVALGSVGGVPELDIPFGRVVIVNTTNNENLLKLRLGQTTADAKLMPNATLALEVIPKYIPGSDPREAPPSTTVHLYARSGSVVWQDTAGSATIESPKAWSITDGVASAAMPDATFPEWIDHEPVEQRSEQLFGAPAIEASLDPTRAAEEQLLELYERSKRREVKSLAARSSMYVGQFVPFVEALRDSDQKSTWKTHIDTLRSAMSLGPDSAEKIYETLVEQRGEQAAGDLYEMLCGYSAERIGKTPDEVKHGALLMLVERLENDSLDYRVLASQDLLEITGMRLMPNPAGSPAERARGVRIWRERLNSGEVMPLAGNQ